MESQIHKDILASEQRELLIQLRPVIDKHEFILIGGTALALLIGHRKSVDFDFHTTDTFSNSQLFDEITDTGVSTQLISEAEDTLIVTCDSIKTSFFASDRLVAVGGLFDTIPLAQIEDIAAMKLLAISQRGAKRDFFDLYFILKDVPFHKIAAKLMQIYGNARINPVHIGKSLVYFSDAEADPEPDFMTGFETSWDDVKRFLREHVKQFSQDLEIEKKRLEE